MKVRILHSLIYSDFSGERVGARRREEGEIVDFPAWYARSLIDSGHAEAFSKPDITDDTTVAATNAARELAEAEDIELADVDGTGVGGRVLVGDVRNYLEA